jgi:hypothetical protein
MILQILNRHVIVCYNVVEIPTSGVKLNIYLRKILKNKNVDI